MRQSFAFGQASYSFHLIHKLFLRWQIELVLTGKDAVLCSDNVIFTAVSFFAVQSKMPMVGFSSGSLSTRP